MKNKPIEPDLSTDRGYVCACRSCGSIRCHPKTGYCFDCDQDDWDHHSDIPAKGKTLADFPTNKLPVETTKHPDFRLKLGLILPPNLNPVQLHEIIKQVGDRISGFYEEYNRTDINRYEHTLDLR